MILLEVIKSSVKPSFKTVVWLLKIMLPVTLAVAILNYYGIIAKFSELTTPIFSFIGIEGKAAIPFFTGALTNIYAAIAVMASLSLDFRTVTILASMCLISHSMIVEAKVQQKAGSKIIYTVPLRLISSLIVGFLINKILPADYAGTLFMPIAEQSPDTLKDMFLGWCSSSFQLSIKIVVIVYLLNLLQAILRRLNLIEKLQYPLTPIMYILGLDKSVSILWIITNTLGLAYGGMAIADELERGGTKPEDVRLMNTSIAISHSLLEDSIIFLSVGVAGFWIFVPRILWAMIAVYAHRLTRLVLKNR